ncbi:monofunctional biosynthetic peptidoglycan transglycosylase [Aromatoleum aromaticum]|uniref:Biosynthetic peptidoglycan transglycosylase n=1 Tax=Aromatoleum aromaticum (strain DSM 19018 / LMG 30748 / EbN1) TaxID=76114 RepID=MTGA_AROAE|nr:monofunctional biosynthetic peptidoglycan transglycosylase [Aromatoleum aromaticum]Q5P6J8.2 RecName: Full=Biosynthetic peptidoglycan transglycosylase; AltName: Full=Glycan polymerase; AltName: Full=Peptidoglycan glycosyltransferase MtgA; Short=PGT [Aromatoleum aromaticum EbN1]NMG55127.1 monofunctional biosynthetic peptidoglycan transglycosylase [Aromatoleum aromaticum]
MKTALRGAGRVLLVLVALFVLYQLWIFTLVLWWSHFNPSSTSFMELRLDELQAKRPDVELRHEWVPYDRISIHLKRAVITAEDDTFIDHDGFDWEGMQRALEKNQRKGRAVAGGSTISQQLAKNLFLSPSKSYFRKAQEALITVMIEAVWSKRRILEVYLNVVEWGNGIFGCEAAARRYFRVAASRLGPAEAARLAVMLPNPRRYEKQFGPRLAAHARRIRSRMVYATVP